MKQTAPIPSTKAQERSLNGKSIVESLLRTGKYSVDTLEMSANEVEDSFGCARFFNDVSLKVRTITLNQELLSDQKESLIAYVDGSASAIGSGISSCGGGGAVIIDKKGNVKAAILIGIQASDYRISSSHAETLAYLATRSYCNQVGLQLSDVYTDGQPSVVAHLSAVGSSDIGPIKWCRGHSNVVPNLFADKLATYSKSMIEIDLINERRRTRERPRRILPRPKFSLMNDIGIDKIQDVDFIVTPFGAEHQKNDGYVNRIVIDAAPISETDMGIVTMEMHGDDIVSLRRRKCPRNKIGAARVCQALVDEAWPDDISDEGVNVELGSRFMKIYNDVVSGESIKQKNMEMVECLAKRGVTPTQQNILDEGDIKNIVVARRDTIQSVLQDIQENATRTVTKEQKSEPNPAGRLTRDLFQKGPL